MKLFSLAFAILMCAAAMGGAWFGWSRVLPFLHQMTTEHYVPAALDSPPDAAASLVAQILHLCAVYVVATLARLLQDPVDVGMVCGLFGCICFSWLLTAPLLASLWYECTQPEPGFLKMTSHLACIAALPFAAPLLAFGGTQIPDANIFGFLAGCVFRVTALLIGYASIVAGFGLPILATLLMFVSVSVWGTNQTLSTMAILVFVLSLVGSHDNEP